MGTSKTGKLKTSKELSMERVIVSDYNPIIYDEDNMADYEFDENGKLPDFVESWKRPESDKKEVNVVMVEDSEKIRIEEEKKSNIHDIKMVGKKTYHCETDNKPDICYHGRFYSYGGEGRVNRAVAFGLSNNNFKTKINDLPCSCHINSSTVKELDILKNMKINKAINIHQSAIQSSYNANDINVFSAYFKDDYELDENCIGNLKNFKDAWVPSYYNYTMFKDKEVQMPVHIIPLGVDGSRYNPNATKIELDETLNSFVFLHFVNNMSNFKMVIKAYLENFTAIDDVSLLLVIKSENDEETNNDKMALIQNNFLEIRETISKKDEDLPHIYLLNKNISEKNMPGLYALSSVLIDIDHHAFGLSILESCAVGKPCIVGNIGGQSEFLDIESSYVIDMMESDEAIYKALKTYMYCIIPNYENIYNHAKKNSRKIINTYTWEHTLHLITERLVELKREYK